MKKIILSLAVFLSMSTAFSQSFMHGAGITVLGTSKSRTGSDLSYGEGFTYSPRFNFFETQALSVSVGIPLSFGLSATTASTVDAYGDYTSSVGLVVNVPLIINLNMGRGSTKENRQKFGYFVGAGFGYHHGDYLTDGIYDPNTGTYTDTYSSNTFGPAANAGVRIGVGRKHKNIEIKLSYMKGINEVKPDIFSIACLFNF
jgi:hypothetical protein